MCRLLSGLVFKNTKAQNNYIMLYLHMQSTILITIYCSNLLFRAIAF